jgi:hypothetical protein
MNKPAIDWATSRVTMLLEGILGPNWRETLPPRRVGATIEDRASNLLRTFAGTLREVAALGPRMHECNHPTDEALSDKLEHLQLLENFDLSSSTNPNAKWFWCTRCGALGEVEMSPGLRTKVEWRRPEAPLSPTTQLKDADWHLEEDERRL